MCRSTNAPNIKYYHYCVTKHLENGDVEFKKYMKTISEIKDKLNLSKNVVRHGINPDLDQYPNYKHYKIERVKLPVFENKEIEYN